MTTLYLATTPFGLPFAPPIASIRGSRLRWWARVWPSNLTMKSWLVLRCSS